MAEISTSFSFDYMKKVINPIITVLSISTLQLHFSETNDASMNKLYCCVVFIKDWIRHQKSIIHRGGSFLNYKRSGP